MPTRKLRASSFIVTSREDVRIRTDGVVVARHKGVLDRADVERAAEHAVASARLEGIEIDPDFVARIIEDMMSGKSAVVPRQHDR